jgi:hypothetical protein
MPCAVPPRRPAGLADESSRASRSARRRVGLLTIAAVVLAVGLVACGGDPTDLSIRDPGAGDTTTVPPGDSTPVDSTPGDSTPGQPGDSTPGQPGDSTPGGQPGDSTPGGQPGDSTPGGQPGDSTPLTLPPPQPVTYHGIPFGPAQMPTDLFAAYSSTVYTATTPDALVLALIEANRTSHRLFVNFTGNEAQLRDANGFNFEKWKARVNRFTHLPLGPYIANGTLLAHFVIDEPQDPSNWNGHPVTPAQIEQMAAYSKQVWPTLTTMARAKLEYLKGGQYPHLDAVRIQYLDRLGPIDDYITKNVAAAKALHLAMVGGLNVLNGGPPNSGIPGEGEGKFAMNADQVRTWGKRFLSEPYLCGFLFFQWEPGYFNRPDIKAAMGELATMAAGMPNRVCRP